jgi:hypothetical protein
MDQLADTNRYEKVNRKRKDHLEYRTGNRNQNDRSTRAQAIRPNATACQSLDGTGVFRETKERRFEISDAVTVVIASVHLPE